MLRQKKGFTLIEVMIVLAIAAAMIGLGMPRLFKNKDTIKTVSRNLLVMSRSIRDKARLTQSTYRIVIRMEPNNDAYWVEKANGVQLIDPEMMTEEGQKKAKEALENLGSDEKPPPPKFQPDKSVMKKEKLLPADVHFSSFESANTKEPITQGEVYIHFSPEGFVEAAALQLTNGNKATWTLVFNPLTGQADIVEKAILLKDIQR
jgi:general secretion pathway protein H